MKWRTWMCAMLAFALAGAGCGSQRRDDSGAGVGDGFGTEALGVTLGDVIYLVGVPSGRCMSVVDGSTADGAALELRDCSGAASQQLRLEAAEGYYVLRVVGSDRCLAVSGASTSAGAGIVQEPCSAAASQEWSGADVGGAYRITSRASGMAIDAYGAGTANGTKIIQWPENGGTNQQWRVVAASDVASYTVTIATSGSGTTSPAPGTYTVQAGTTGAVTATPASGATFTGWSGAATGTANPLTVTVNGNMTLTANFAPAAASYTLTIATSGSGTTSPAAGTHSYAAGSSVTVTATPASGNTFTGWSGAATGAANPVTVTMDGNETLTASFAPSGGACEQGTTSTAWATSCPTAPATCTAGTWTPAGSENGDPLQYESAHFAFYWSGSVVSAAQAQAAASYLESTVWATYMGSPIYFPEPYCSSANKKKASIHIRSDYPLWGGGWGNGYMGMWIGPGALADHWGLAHEFMHALQSTTGGLQGCNPNTCGWIWESHANFMPHQLSEYRGDVHCSEMLVNAPHIYLGSTRDRYCNWQFMEYLKDRHCYKAVNDIWTGAAAQRQGDPFLALRANMGWTQAQLNDFFGEWAMHNVTWDYENPPPTSGGNQGSTYRSRYGAITSKSAPERRQRLTQLDPIDLASRRFATPSAWAPQRWGYNVVRLYPDSGATSVTVKFRGVTGGNNGWRWGLVATDSGITSARYSAVQPGTDGQLTFCVNSGESLWLVVVGAPTAHETIAWDQMYNTVHRYPWMVELAGAWPEGWQGGAQAACPSGLVRHANGGGCAPSSLSSSVYVGPYAQVLGGNVSGSARIDEHAQVVSGTVSGGTVAGLTILSDSFTVSGGKVATTFYPLGFFESGQSVSGSAQVIGDVEYRGQGLSKSSGTYYGFVDSSTGPAGNTTDVSPAPPYTWRP